MKCCSVIKKNKHKNTWEKHVLKKKLDALYTMHFLTLGRVNSFMTENR